VTDKDRDQAEEQPKVVIRDRRRIDPETGAPRTTGSNAQPAGDNPAGRAATGGLRVEKSDKTEKKPGTKPADAKEKEAVGLKAELDERTKDLQRVTAEYANYRKRVDRDRLAVVEQATAAVLTNLLPVLDDIDRARAHGDLTGAFAAVAEQIQGSLTKVGLTAFGEAGDAFDPTFHEAVMHSTSGEVTEPTCVEVFRRGYTLGERLLRAAMVSVAEPSESAPAAASGSEPAPPESATSDADGPAGGERAADAGAHNP
jgi:molecular chaperone GrpE